MIVTSETLTKISPALVEAEGAIGGALKDASNSHFKSKYATLTAIVAASKAALKDHQIAVIQSPGRITDGSIQMTTRLLHASGEWIETVMDVPLGKRDPQGMGSTTTYGRRYALAAALNIPVVDDDAESGMLRGEAEKPAEPIEQKPARQTPHPDADDMLDWGDLLSADAPDGSMYEVGAYDKTDSKTVFAALQKTMRMSQTAAELAHWSHENAAEIWKLNSAARHHLRERFDALDEKLPVNMTEIA